MTSKFPPTAEQEAILAAATKDSASLMVTAYAGCGKTSTLELLSHALPKAPSLALAFNVKIKKELEQRFPGHFEVLTLNGLGHRAWARFTGRRLTLEDRKLGKLITQELKDQGGQAEEDWSDLRALVNAARQQGLTPDAAGLPRAEGLLSDTPEVWMDLAFECGIVLAAQERLIALARKILTISCKMACGGVIDFDDQIYMSTCFGGQFPQFPLLMVDEAQDLSPLNHKQVAKVVGLDGRLIVVGDPKQAIYAFRGADSASMGKLRKLRKVWVDLPLATTFRCPKVVVGRQQEHAPGFVAWASNIEGRFGDILEFVARKPSPNGLPLTEPVVVEKVESTWAYKDLEQLAGGKRVAMLCRNNAPLLSMAFKLLKGGVGVTILGRDIGKSLIALAKKTSKDDDTPIAQFVAQVEVWMASETSMLEANGKDGLVAGVRDRGECLLAVAESGAQTVGELRSALESLFAREYGVVTLATGHRSKGLEWPVVVHLDPWRIPSRFAQSSPAQMEQEMNLRYVIETRAQDTLVEANVEDFE